VSGRSSNVLIVFEQYFILILSFDKLEKAKQGYLKQVFFYSAKKMDRDL
jgi:hypothetical protein